MWPISSANVTLLKAELEEVAATAKGLEELAPWSGGLCSKTASSWLCGFKQFSSPLRASVSSFVKLECYK